MNDLAQLANFNALTTLERRALILCLEAYVREQAAHEGEDTAVRSCAVLHYRAPGNYAREFLAPPGAVLVGKIHKHAHINVLSLGSCTVFTEAGREELKAPMTFVSQAGAKRVVVTHSELVWTTVHPTDKETLAEIEDEMIATSYDQLAFEPVAEVA